MTDDERDQFLEDINKSIGQIESCISELAESVKSGKMGLKGQAIDHSMSVFQILDNSLTNVKKEVEMMKVQRSVAISRAKNAAPSMPIGQLSSGKYKNARTAQTGITMQAKTNVEVAPQFERSLAQEHDNIVEELLDFNSQLNQADEKVENIGMIMRSFNELISSQNQQIRIIKQDVEKAQENYQEAHQQINKSIDKNTLKNLWMAALIFVLGIVLVLKA